MINITLVLSAMLEIALPFVLFLWLRRRYGVPWILFLAGVLTFIGSQVVHLPLVGGLYAVLGQYLSPAVITTGTILLQAVLLGLLAGLCEEPARWVGYRVLKQRANSFPAALALGAGHGGIEAILVGINLATTFVIVRIVLQTGTPIGPLTPELAAQTLAMGWYMPLISFIERVFAVVLHLTLSVMVWWAVSRRLWVWFVAAILFHALVDAIAVGLMSLTSSVALVEIVVGVMALGTAYLVYRLVSREDPSLLEPQLPPFTSEPPEA